MRLTNFLLVETFDERCRWQLQWIISKFIKWNTYCLYFPSVDILKEYIPTGGDDKAGGPTIVVVSLIVEIQGDTTKFDGAGYSISGTRDVLSSISSDCRVDQGYCLNAAEVFWTPSDFEEVLSRSELILDFPELIDFWYCHLEPGSTEVSIVIMGS